MLHRASRRDGPLRRIGDGSPTYKSSRIPSPGIIASTAFSWCQRPMRVTCRPHTTPPSSCLHPSNSTSIVPLVCLTPASGSGNTQRQSIAPRQQNRYPERGCGRCLPRKAGPQDRWRYPSSGLGQCPRPASNFELIDDPTRTRCSAIKTRATVRILFRYMRAAGRNPMKEYG